MGAVGSTISSTSPLTTVKTENCLKQKSILWKKEILAKLMLT